MKKQKEPEQETDEEIFEFWAENYPEVIEQLLKEKEAEKQENPTTAENPAVLSNQPEIRPIN